MQRKTQRSGETIGTLIQVPRELSLGLARIIIDRAEKGQQLTKPQLIVSYVEKGVKAEQEVR